MWCKACLLNRGEVSMVSAASHGVALNVMLGASKIDVPARRS
jgi:hypothetical protein